MKKALIILTLVIGTIFIATDSSTKELLALVRFGSEYAIYDGFG